MKSLYAPWRSDYSQHEERLNKEGTSQQDCVFCQQIASGNDAKYFILRRFEHAYVVFNKFPYNAGHLLVIPYSHVSTLAALSKEARVECMELVNAGIEIIQTSLKAHGFNVGFNIGKAGGAGIPGHIHLHILPRWYGDTSFLPTISDTKAISIDLVQLYNELKPLFDKIELNRE